MMKAHVTGLGAAVFLAVATLVSPASAADQLILVVDSNKLWEQTAVGKDVQRQVNELEKQWEGQLNKVKSGLDTEQTNLESQKERGILPEEEFQKQARTLFAKQQQLRAEAQRAQMAMQVAQRRAQAQFYQAIQPTLLKIVEKRKGDMLLERSQTLYASTDHEITAEAIAAINKQLTSLKVELLPKEAAQNQKAAGGKKKGKKK